jgi:hypothetical protein
MTLLSEKVLQACEKAGVDEGRRLLMDWLVRLVGCLHRLKKSSGDASVGIDDVTMAGLPALQVRRAHKMRADNTH